MCFLALSANAQVTNNQPNKVIMDSTKSLMMLHNASQSVSAQLLFKGEESSTRALQIKKDGLLKEHITKTEALLICISGEVVYEDELNNNRSLKAGEYIRILPMVKHWVKGLQDSELLLIK